MSSIYRKNHFNAVIFKSYIKYLENNFKDINIEEKLKSIGLDKSFFDSTSNWVSLEFNEFLVQLLGKKNDSSFRFNIGKDSASQEGLGSALYFMLKNTISWETGAKMLPKMNALFNKVVKVQVVKVNKEEAIWHFTPVFENLNNYEKNILTNLFEDIIDNSVGYYVGVAKLKNLRNLSHSVIKLENQVGYEVRFNYKLKENLSWLKKRYVALNLSVVFSIFLYAGNNPITYFVSLLLSLTILGLLFFYTKYKQIKEFADSSKQNIFELDEKNKSLNETQMKLEKKLIETNTAYSIVTSLSSAQSIQEVFYLAILKICNNLNYDESSVYMQIGETKKYKKILMYSNSQVTEPIDSTELTEEESKKILTSESENFLAFPISSSKQLEAFIVFENYKNGKSFTLEDKQFCLSVSVQISNAFEKQVAKQLLIDSYQNEIELSQSYSRFVPHETLKMLNYRKISDVRIGDCIEVDLGIMFCDMWNFTAMCENMSSKEVLGLLNSYYSKIAPVIKQNNGTIDKYMGDGLMAIFPSFDEATKASIEIQNAIISYNLNERLNDRQAIRVGIGLSYGSVVFAPLGFERRLELTAISDVVNIASRLDQKCRLHDAYVMVSCLDEKIIEFQKHGIYFKHGELTVKGKKKTVNSYELLLDTKRIKKHLCEQTDPKKKDYLESILKNCESKISKNLIAKAS